MRVLGDDSSPMEREATENEFLRISFCDMGE
jgi:hypothetical protein